MDESSAAQKDPGEESQISGFSEHEYLEKFEKAKRPIAKPSIVPVLNFTRLSTRMGQSHKLSPAHHQFASEMHGGSRPSNHMCEIESAELKSGEQLGKAKNLDKKQILADRAQPSSKAKKDTVSRLLRTAVCLYAGAAFVVDTLAWNNCFWPFSSLLIGWIARLTALGSAGFFVCAALSLLFLDLLYLPGRIAFRVFLSCSTEDIVASFLTILITDLTSKLAIFWLAALFLASRTTGKSLATTFMVAKPASYLESRESMLAIFLFASSHGGGLVVLAGLVCKRRLAVVAGMGGSLLLQAVEHLVLSLQKDQNRSSLESTFSQAGGTLWYYRGAFVIRLLLLALALLSIYKQHRAPFRKVTPALGHAPAKSKIAAS